VSDTTVCNYGGGGVVDEAHISKHDRPVGYTPS